MMEGLELTLNQGERASHWYAMYHGQCSLGRSVTLVWDTQLGGRSHVHNKRHRVIVIGWVGSSHLLSAYAQALAPRTSSQWNFIWRCGLSSSHEANMKCSERTLISYDRCLHKKSKLGHRHVRVQWQDQVKTQGEKSQKEPKSQHLDFGLQTSGFQNCKKVNVFSVRHPAMRLYEGSPSKIIPSLREGKSAPMIMNTFYGKKYQYCPKRYPLKDYSSNLWTYRK